MSTSLDTRTDPRRDVSTPSRRVLRLPPDVLRELPDVRSIRVDINGCHAGTLLAIPDAMRELALGWAIMHGFLDPEDIPEHVTIDGDRVSIMVANGEDVDRRRLEAVGWIDGEPLSMPEEGEGPQLFIPDETLIALIDRCWSSFRHDDGGDGYHQVAVASAESVLCIARDQQVEYAAAKVLGWLASDGRDTGASMMLVRGMIGRRVIEAAARMCLALVVTSGIPTAEACRAAQGLGVSVVGMATARTIGILVDHGHLDLG